MLIALQKDPNSLTGQYLSGAKKIAAPKRRPINPLGPLHWLHLNGATGNNLKNVDLHLPLQRLVCVTGVSGSGKSTFINDTLAAALAHKLNRAQNESAPYKSISGLDHLDKIITVIQSPIGLTPRSNPATYTGLFTPIRELFAGTPEARTRSYDPGRFSFNVKGGRCEHCQGDGVINIELLLDVLNRLVDVGNSMVIIEHNLDLIKTADWIIDLRPEDGLGGGQIVAEGTPEEIAKHPDSATGKYLAPYLKK